VTTLTPRQSSKPPTSAGCVRLAAVCAGCTAPLVGRTVRLKWHSMAGAWLGFRYHPQCASRAAANLYTQHVGRDVCAVVFLDA